MIAFTIPRRVALALAGCLSAGAPAPSQAGVKDYRFELVDKIVKVGPDTPITVRLVDVRTGKPVSGAVIFATRLDMAPDGMAGMATGIAPEAGTEPGVYRFRAKVTMAGGWRLSLAAKIQGEEGTVEDKLVLKAGE